MCALQHTGHLECRRCRRGRETMHALQHGELHFTSAQQVECSLRRCGCVAATHIAAVLEQVVVLQANAMAEGAEAPMQCGSAPARLH